MDSKESKTITSEETASPEVKTQQTAAAVTTSTTTEAASKEHLLPQKDKKAKHKKHERRCKRSKKSRKHDSSDSSDSDDDDTDDTSASTDSDSSSSEEESKQKSRRRKLSSKKKKTGKKSKSRARRTKHVTDSDPDSDDSSSDEEPESESSAEERRRRKKKKSGRGKGGKRRADPELEESDIDDPPPPDDQAELFRKEWAAFQALNLDGAKLGGRSGRRIAFRKPPRATTQHLDEESTEKEKSSRSKGRGKKKRKAAKRASTLEYKRVDQLWDSSIHDYKLTESAEHQEDEFQEFVFTVRRRFDWENKYKSTVVDIKSTLLREALQEIMKDVKGISLVEDQPSIDPNMLFLYLEELRTYAKTTLKAKMKAEKKSKSKRRLKQMTQHCKVLVKYLDEDYKDTKKTLYPMLEAGNITFDLLWALFKPNGLAYTTTYGSVENPRCYKVDYATKESSFMRGDWYSIEGRYLEYDGKSYGLGDFEVQVDSFKGPRKIASLSTYPIQYHKDPEALKRQLIERGKRFVAMEGMNYKFHKGLAFMKKKKTVAKVNINGRIMIDPAIFRRINPNYPISLLKPKDVEDDTWSADDDGDSSSCGCDGSGSDEERPDIDNLQMPAEDRDGQGRTKFKVIFDKDNNAQVVEIAIDINGQEMKPENLDKLPEGTTSEQKREFTEEELLIASPVVLGFAFSEKLWLEFSLSSVREIEWNDGAFESLVLPANQKSIVKALVESHKFHAAKTIDDVVQGKGKGLVAVLHGPPGTGKTLTAEGIAELLKCPLYMVSAGELGTDPRMLEHELQKILDIAHSWGAVLLLDEADVFLEKREVHDIHRNALVSIFLRLLEYFQGILFLTTNRVETFDDAFQSRIHVALRYGELTAKAKKAVWKMFIEKVLTMEAAADEAAAASTASKPDNAVQSPMIEDSSSKSSVTAVSTTSHFGDQEYEILSRNEMNGRQIKNAVRTAQALAVNEVQKLSMQHIKRVLEVAESFDRDLKGGTGYLEAMRSYT